MTGNPSGMPCKSALSEATSRPASSARAVRNPGKLVCGVKPGVNSPGAGGRIGRQALPDGKWTLLMPPEWSLRTLIRPFLPPPQCPLQRPLQFSVKPTSPGRKSPYAGFRRLMGLAAESANSARTHWNSLRFFRSTPVSSQLRY